MVGDYPDPLAAILFEVNLLAIGLLLFFIWNYATTGRRFVGKELGEGVVRVYARRALLVPAVSALGILFAILGFGWTTLVYATTPFLVALIERRG